MVRGWILFLIYSNSDIGMVKILWELFDDFFEDVSDFWYWLLIVSTDGLACEYAYLEDTVFYPADLSNVSPDFKILSYLS